MKHIQHAQQLRRRLALLVLVSLINFLALPFLLASANTVTAAAPLNPFDGPTEFIRKIPLTTNDIVYSSTTGRIYASIPSSAGACGNSIAAIDPGTGLITSSTLIGSDPDKLALQTMVTPSTPHSRVPFVVRRFDALTNTAWRSVLARCRFILRSLYDQ